MKNATILLSITFSLLLSCSKENCYSKKLMKGENWKITGLSVDGETYGFYGNWIVTQDVNIYDSVPSIEWYSNGQNSTFQWQFQNKGKTYEISYMDTTCVNCTTPIEELDLQCYYLSGKYDVIIHKRNQMQFASRNTVGFSGQKVEINIERVN